MSQIQVPKGWELKTVEEICEKITSGGTPSRDNPQYFGGNIPWVKMTDLKTEYIFQTEENITEEGLTNSSAKLFPKDTVLMAMYTYDMGKTAILGIEAATNQAICGLQCKKDVIPKFLYYFFKSQDQNIKQLGSGGAQPNINQGKIKSLSIPIPSYDVQKKVVQKLDYILMELNKKLKIVLETQDKQIQLSRKQKKFFYQYVLDNACFGKFTTDWKLKHSIESFPTHILKLNDDQLVESSIRKQFPKEWCVVTLKPISEIRSGVTLGRSLHGDLITLPYLRVANVQDGYLDLRKIKQISIKPEEKEKWLLRKGDILLTEGGDWDKLGRGTVWDGEIKDCIHQNHIFRVRLNPEEFNPYFVSFVLSSTYGKQYFQQSAKRTTNLASINSTQLKAFPMLYPTLSEQNEIVKIVNEKIYSTKILEDKINEYMRLLEKSKNYIKQLSLSILDQAFSGKLVN